MPSPNTLPMDIIVDVSVQISPQSPIQPTFNQALIIGPSDHITTATRVKKYYSAAAMLTDGFLVNDPEYVAANLYFAQSPTPSVLWVGRQDGDNETALDAVVACRAANYQWWAFYVCGADKLMHQALAAWAQTAAPKACYFYTTNDADALAGTAGNIFTTLKAASYNRAFGQYATDQGGAYLSNPDAAAAAMGVAMGLNTGLANSFFTMKFKTLTGVVTEPLTPTDIGVIEDNNGNLYLNYGNAYNLLEQGKVANGQFFDEILNLDMLESDIQYGIMNLLTSNPAVPLTDAGQTQLLHAVNEACEKARQRGFIAPGVWNGANILNLKNGDAVPTGYLCQSAPYSTQDPADRQARKAMPIYVSLIEAGSVHSITIAVYVQR